MEKVIENIEKNMTKKVIAKIGKIEIETIKNNLYYANILYYLFPLIEKTFLEIVKLNPYASPEVNKQGTYRTMQSIFDDKLTMNMFKDCDEEAIDLLISIYEKDGFRNKVMHGQQPQIEYDFILDCVCLFSYLVEMLNLMSTVEIKEVFLCKYYHIQN